MALLKKGEESEKAKLKRIIDETLREGEFKDKNDRRLLFHGGNIKEFDEAVKKAAAEWNAEDWGI